MLSLLKIENIALIDRLEIEFGPGLDLLTGETGSGKSIIVDSVSTLTGDRVSTELIKQGAETARIEGLFSVTGNKTIAALLSESGIEISDELIIRRELSSTGKNRIFVNNQLVTQGFLKKLGIHLADIHGQGEQASLYDPGSHLGMLDDFAGGQNELGDVAAAFAEWTSVRSELDSLERDESEKLQLLDILRFQVSEINAAGIAMGEEEDLELERTRLNNVEKLSTLSDEANILLYEDDGSTMSTLERASKKISELAEFDRRFAEYEEGLKTATAVIEEAARTARDFRSGLEFSPERINEIESRLAEITRLKRKYGGSVESVLEHLSVSQERLASIETAEFREEELRKTLAAKEQKYSEAAARLTIKRTSAAVKFKKAVESELKAVALEKARFEVNVEDSKTFAARGSDKVEFYFSANPGEAPRPLAKVASGGEASRLMLVLKTASRSVGEGKTAVFDEVDIGIGGRVAEAVGRRLKALAAHQQVFCVTHQAQIASLADHHFVVEKHITGKTTKVTVRELTSAERIDEIARMLAGEQITEAARENAKAMLAAAS